MGRKTHSIGKLTTVETSPPESRDDYLDLKMVHAEYSFQFGTGFTTAKITPCFWQDVDNGAGYPTMGAPVTIKSTETTGQINNINGRPFTFIVSEGDVDETKYVDIDVSTIQEWGLLR